MSDMEVEGIAIIGMAGRFPEARNVDEFWRNLRDGVESVTFFTDEELADNVPPELLNNPNYIKANAVLEDGDRFDGAFFGFNPREAEILDPQQRVFLECAWEAIESSGSNPDLYEGVIGVFGGVDLSSYLMNIFSNRDIVASVGALQSIMSNDKDHLCTRVSYKLNLKGPSVCVQSACSTSLTAVHLACRSLLNYECDIALAGGSSIKWPQRAGYLYEEASINSPDGHCRAFDARAKGTIGGNGVGVVVLKRLADALVDGDCIHAVIKGSAMNNDGSQKISYTAPSVDGQSEVIVMAQEMAGVDPATITYIEAHGTATELGDTIEIAALTKAFRARTDKVGYCGVGSVKTNIGHLDAAAGIAGLIKTVLALKHKMLPPSLHFTEPNPNIDFANSPFYVNAELKEWNPQGVPRRAGVSSYGMGGTNVHVVVEEFTSDDRSRAARDWQLLTLSARTETALDKMTVNLGEYLSQHPDSNLADVAYTCQVGRKAFKHRRALVCRDVAEAVKSLETLDPRRVLRGTAEGGKRRVVMMFSGQGTQYANMGLELYRSEKVFRQEIDRSAELLQPHLGFDLRQALYPREDEITEASEKLTQTFITQPALFVIEYALARWFQSLGVVAEAMIGHSIGEYVAACLSGVFSLEDALRLVAARGRLMQELPGGAMLAVQIAEKELQPWLNGKVSLAANNGPSMCVISGPHESIDAVQAELTERNIGCRRLHTSHAFHSSMMEPILQSFIQQLEKASLKAPQVPYISNVTGTWITEAEATSHEYWARHLRQPVRFSAGLAELVKDPRHVMLEIGPGQTLCTLVRQQPDRPAGQISVTSLRPPQERQSDTAFALTALGKLWLAGVEVDWRAFHREDKRQRVSLPAYPFERQRYWIDPARNPDAGAARPPAAGKRADIADWFYALLWRQTPPLAQAAAPEQTTRWLLIGERDGLMGRITQRLKELGQDVIVVEHGAGQVKLGDDAYSVDPRNADDYYRLLRELETRDCLPQVALHFGALAPLEPAESRQELFLRAQERSFYSLLNLTKAIGRINISDALQIGVISSGLHDVTGQEEIIPEKSTVLGLCKVIPQEYPNIVCRNIDLPLEGDRAAFKPEMIDQLIAEMSAESTDLIIAYRNHRRWIQTFDPVRLDEPASHMRGLREGGVYLITGGLGGVGLALAEHFVRRARARLVLIGRSTFPPRDDWPKWLAEHDAQDTTSVKIRRLQMFEELGGAVTVLSGNVADKRRMQEIIAEVYGRFGVLHGVVHGAGINGERSVRAISETGPTECEWHFEPKILGLQTLSEVLQGRELDFCLLLSSLSAVLGGLGFTAYSAANVYMDAFVQQQSKTSAVPWITVNWDGWLLSEGGLTSNIGAALDALSMKPAEGAAAFDRILASPVLSQVVVSTGDLHRRMEQWLRPGAFGTALRSDVESTGVLYPRPELATDYVAPTTSIEQSLADTWRELLGIEQIGVHDNFFELGGHSLLATQLVSRMRKLFNVELSLRRFFETPTISDLAELVLLSQAEQLGAEKLAELSDEIQALSEEELKELLESEKQTLSKDASH